MSYVTRLHDAAAAGHRRADARLSAEVPGHTLDDAFVHETDPRPVGR